MNNKRKISIRKVLRALTTLVVVSGCVLAVMSANHYQKQDLVKGVAIRIQNSKDAGFHDESSIKKLLLGNTHIDLKHATVEALNIYRLEQIAKANPWIASADAFIDNRKVLNIIITQRVPSVRIFEQDGSSYYLDSSLTPIPISPAYVAYVPVITQLPALKDDSVGRSIKAQAYYVAKHIEADKFWNAQVSEIVWKPTNDFTLIPNIGQHVVRIGDSTMLAEKLANVFQFYQKIMNRIGWEKYTLVDARFKGQIVASPSLPWKPPVDKAMNTMNWVKSVVGNDTASSAFAGFVMDTPPTNVASDIQIIPSVSMDAMKDVKVTQERHEPDAKDSLAYVQQQKVIQTQLPKTTVPIQSVATPTKSTTQPATTASKTNTTTKPASSTTKEKTNAKQTTTTKPKTQAQSAKAATPSSQKSNTTPAAETEKKPSQEKPKYILEH